jgi:hypothetical protein
LGEKECDGEEFFLRGVQKWEMKVSVRIPRFVIYKASWNGMS